MPPTENDNPKPRPTKRLSPSELRFIGTVHQFEVLLQLQLLVLEGRLGGPRDGAKMRRPDER